jgi:RND family efflux transporter MFP subunit
MASKAIYSAVAVVGIAAAAGAAYWHQNKPSGPKEMSGAGAASAPGGGTPAAGGAPRGPGMPSVEVAKVEVSRLQDDAQAIGSLRSRQNVMLRPEVSGRVQTLGFTDGGRVRRGDVIMQLEDGLQRAEVRQAEAQVSISRANFKRNQELVAQNFVAQRVLDESAANVQVVEAQLSLACARWDRMRVVAPFDGTVGIRNVNIGDYVKDGADLVNLEDLSSMFVDFRLPERFIGKLRREQVIELQLDAMPGRQFKAKIDAIDPQLDTNGRSVLVRASLANTAGEPLVQRPGGPGGAQGAGRPAGAAGTTGATGVPSAQGARPAQGVGPGAGRPAQRPAAPAAQANPLARPVDTVASTCAPFSSSTAAASRAAGAPGAGAPGSGSRGLGTNAAGARPAQAGRPAGAPAAAAGGGPLRPGMFARVTAVFNVKDAAFSIPEEAIVPQGGRQFVIRLVEQTEAQAKEIAAKQAADAAKAAEAAKAAAAAATASATGGTPAGAAGGPAGTGGAQPYFMGGFVDGKRWVSQRVEVRLGIRRPGKVEILDGLSETDTVVVAGQQRVQRDFTPVRVIELGRPPSGAAVGTTSGAAASAPGSTPAAPAASAARP